MAGERQQTDLGTETPIAENEQVRALLALLKENNSPTYAVTRHFIVDAKSILFSQLHPY